MNTLQKLISVYYYPEHKAFSKLERVSDRTLTFLLLAAAVLIAAIALMPNKVILKAVVLGYVILP